MNVQSQIEEKFKTHFKPRYLEVLNESSMHNVPIGSETHFKLIVVSDIFEKQNRIERHRLIHELLASELRTQIHALTMVLKTSIEWEEQKKVLPTPKCLGGQKK